MSYTADDRGILNNYEESAIYLAEYPTEALGFCWSADDFIGFRA